MAREEWPIEAGSDSFVRGRWGTHPASYGGGRETQCTAAGLTAFPHENFHCHGGLQTILLVGRHIGEGFSAGILQAIDGFHRGPLAGCDVSFIDCMAVWVDGFQQRENIGSMDSTVPMNTTSLAAV